MPEIENIDVTGAAAPTQAAAKPTRKTPLRNVDVSTQTAGDSITGVTGQDKLKFAKQVLFFLFIGAATICTAYARDPQSEPLKQMFEFLKVGLLPIAVLMISFYFPNGNK